MSKSSPGSVFSAVSRRHVSRLTRTLVVVGVSVAIGIQYTRATRASRGSGPGFRENLQDVIREHCNYLPPGYGSGGRPAARNAAALALAAPYHAQSYVRKRYCPTTAPTFPAPDQ